MGQVKCYFRGLKVHINLESAVIKYRVIEKDGRDLKPL
jgi:hypothetical protein